MRVLFLGDIVGSRGREAVLGSVPRLRRDLQLDVVIVNGENAAGGRGTTAKICDELFAAGVDVVSGGNHTFQQRDFYPYLDQADAVLRPANYPPGAPGHGVVHLDGLTVINLIGRTFMGSDYDDPFRFADTLLAEVPGSNAIFVDFHAEATSEKQALGWYLDGRVAAVVGTHTHVATADARVLPKGTAYCTDAGMCGARDSVIGDDADAVVSRFLTQMPTRLPAAEGVAMLNGVVVDIDPATKLATSITRHDVFDL
jgi:2',3'-cyclic-nucleotide 2'-phosphodiesterase